MKQGFQVGEWVVQPDLGILTRGDEQVQLEPKVMEVLVYLVHHAGELLPKEKIIEAVWTDAFVTDEVLTNAISELRKAFGDDAKEPTFIQTLPRRGYRLIAPVSWVNESMERSGSAGSEHGSEPTPRPLWRHPVVFVGGGLLVILAGLLIWQLAPEAPKEGPIDSIAILPFRNESANPDVNYLCSGIPGSVSASLSSLRSLRVIPTGNLARFRTTDTEPRSAAEQLGVRAVLQGWLNRVGDELSIRVELSDGPQNRVLWGGRFHRPFTEVLEVEVEIAEQIAKALRVQLDGEERKQLARRPATNLEAYEAYLKGSEYAWEFGESAAKVGMGYFEQAIVLDPNYLEAYLGLSVCYEALCLSVAEYCAEYRQTVEKALEVDDTSAEAHIWMGSLLALTDRDWEAAGQEFRRAKELDPGSSRPKTVSYPLWMGLHEEALAELEDWSLKMDPLSCRQHVGLVEYYYVLRKYDRVFEIIDRFKERDPGNTLGWLREYAYLGKGMEREAFSAFLASRQKNRSRELLDGYRQVYEESGIQGVYRYRLDQEELPKKALDRAGVYALAGENDLAFVNLEEVYKSAMPWPFMSDVRFDSLRDDRRYEELLRKLNLPEEAIAIHLKPGR